MRKLVEKVDAVLSGKWFFLLLGVILLLGLILRIVYLDADPPVGITRSQDFSTDPCQYNYFAQNAVDRGNSNPYGDPRFAQWEKSSQTLLALIVFNLFGTGRAEGNAVSVIFNLASILLLALALKNFGSRLAAIVFAVFASFDFTMVWFARTPFLEGAQNFWICAAVYFFSKGQGKTLFYILAGIACAAAAFFGKMIALFMAGVFLVAWVILYVQEKENRKVVLGNAVCFYGGFLATTLFYLAFVYLPSRAQVSGYLTEQAFGLYGAPKALQSPNDFFYQIMTLIWDTEFFGRMPVVTLLAFIAGAGILSWFAMRSKSGKTFGEFNIGWVLVLVWFGAGFVALFPWNYRPLRYQTTIMFPAFALAAIAIAYLIEFVKRSKSQAKKSQESRRNLPLLATMWGLWLLPAIALLILTLLVTDRISVTTTFVFKSSFVAALIFVLVGACLALISNSLGASFRRAANLGVILAGALVLLSVVLNVIQFVKWTTERQYSLLTADRDLNAILGNDAVITGSYATAFTQENKLGCVVHMFGVVNVDTEFFAKYPITHIAMDEGNEKFAREQYPNLIGNAKFVTRYYARGIPVKVFRIAEISPNSEARNYLPTDYEIAQDFIAQNQADSAEFYLRRFQNSGVPNYSANLYVGDALASATEYARALESYRKVQEFSPGDALSAAQMGNCFLSLAGPQTGTAYFDSALVYYKVAQRMFKSDPRVNDMIKQLERRTQ